MIRRSAFEAALRTLSGQGFKILIDLFASSRGRSPSGAVLPVPPAPPRREQARHAGCLGVPAAAARQLVGHIVPVRFALFAMIGGLASSSISPSSPSCSNSSASISRSPKARRRWCDDLEFPAQQLVHLSRRRLRGWRLLSGLLSFYVVCSVGAVGNVGIAAYVFQVDRSWWLAALPAPSSARCGTTRRLRSSPGALASWWPMLWLRRRANAATSRNLLRYAAFARRRNHSMGHQLASAPGEDRRRRVVPHEPTTARQCQPATRIDRPGRHRRRCRHCRPRRRCTRRRRTADRSAAASRATGGRDR